MAQTAPSDATDLPEPVPTGNDPPTRVRSFPFFFADERREWSDDAARIRGYEPGAAPPTTAPVMRRKHRDDQAKMAAHLDSVRRICNPVSSRHRVIDIRRQTREIVVAGQQIVGEGGVVIGTVSVAAASQSGIHRSTFRTRRTHWGSGHLTPAYGANECWLRAREEKLQVRPEDDFFNLMTVHPADFSMGLGATTYVRNVPADRLDPNFIPH